MENAGFGGREFGYHEDTLKQVDPGPDLSVGPRRKALVFRTTQWVFRKDSEYGRGSAQVLQSIRVLKNGVEIRIFAIGCS